MPVASLGSVDVYYETSGRPQDPCVLLIHGFGAQLVQWPAELYEGLAEHDLFVVRMDNRDVGLSTKFDGQIPQLGPPAPGATVPSLLEPPPYTLSDMGNDALGLLDSLGIDRAHFVGASLGGAVVQRIGVESPERVLTMTLLMTTTGDPDLPASTPEAAAALFSPAPPDRQGYIDHMTTVLRTLWGTSYDEDRARLSLAERYDRSYYPEGMIRQMAAIVADGDRTLDLKSVTAPTLVLHGREDPLVPPGHGEAVAAATRAVKTVVLDGMGHDLPPAKCAEMVEHIAEHVRRYSNGAGTA